MKICGDCGLEKLEQEFYLVKRTGKLYTYCKLCTSKQHSAYSNSPEIKKHKSEYAKSHRERDNNRRRERNREDYAYYKWKIIKSRAKKLGLEFNLVVSDLVFPEICPVFYTKFDVNDMDSNTAPCVDRNDNNKGYTKDNIGLISSRANRIKSDGTLEEHRKIRDFYKKLMGEIEYNDNGV